jgi:hypothetical protein
METGMKHRLACLILALLAAPAGAAEWFPAEPGIGEPQYVIYEDTCGERPPVGRPVLRLLDAGQGRWRLEITQSVDLLCFATPPPGSARIYAFEMPEQIGGVPVDHVEVRESLAGDEQVTVLPHRPTPKAMPTSIAGTWLLPEARHQGLLISVDEFRRLVVSLNTYDAQGRLAWYSGSGWPDANGIATVELTDTGSGAFMSTPQTPASVRSWGEIDIDWTACGALQASWRPQAHTGLPAGSGEFAQLTRTGEALCDLAALAAAHNGQPQPVSYDIVD